MAADPYRESRVFGQGTSSRVVSGTYFPAESRAEALRGAQDKAFSVALGGGLRQLGIETPAAEGSNYLRPGQIADLLSLRGGADPGQVLGGASAPGIALSSLFSTPFGEWPTAYKLGAGVAVLGLLAFLRGALGK